MNAANRSETEDSQDDAYAVLAALCLLSEERWPIENVARALGRSVKWIKSAVDEAIAAEAVKN